MLESDEKLDHIAYQLGCSASSFSVMFRRIRGESPAAWRTMRRPGPPVA
jgi:hypothetical protein